MFETQEIIDFLRLNGVGRLAYYLVQLCSVFGWFSLLSRVLKIRDPILLLPSLYISPLLIFFMSAFLGVSLTLSSSLAFGVAFLGLFFVRPLFQNEQIKTPLYFFLLWSFILSLYGQTPYYPTQWDEFSHWLTYPVQLTQHRTLVSSQFYNLQTLSYPPLYPLTLAFPNFLLNSSPLRMNYLIVPLLSWLALFAGLYPHLKKTFFGLTLPLILSLLFLRGLPSSVLIEWPQLHLLSLLFILASGGLRFSRRTDFWLILLLTMELIFLKNSNYFVLIPLVLFLVSRRLYKESVYVPLLVLLVSVPLLYIWKQKTSFVDYPLQPGGLASLPWPEFFNAASVVLWKMIKKLFNFLGYIEVLLALVVVVSNRQKLGIKKIFTNPVSLTLFIYFVVMFVTYVGFFGAYEGLRIASFERYYPVVLLPLCFTVVFNERRRFFPFLRSFKKSNIVLIFTVVGLYRFIEPQIRVQGEVDKFMAIWAEAETHLTGNQKRGIFIAQGDDGSDLVQMRYASLQSYPWVVDWGGSFSFSRTPANYWTQKLTDGFIEQVQKFDFLIIYRGDAEIVKELSQLQGLSRESCFLDLKQVILLEQMNQRWECHRLNASARANHID